MSHQQNEPIQHDLDASRSTDDEIDLLGFLQTAGEEKWLLLGFPFFCACLAAIISLYLTPVYTAKATFVVPDRQQSSSASAVLDQLGGLGGLAGSLSKSPVEMYVAMMQSNSVQDQIIAEFDLVQRYQKKTYEEARQILISQVKITPEKKTGFVMIEVKDQSPDFAAKLANAYLKPFREVLNRMSLEEAHLRRDFFSKQIEVIAQRPFRDPFVQSTLMNSMIKQYEAARIDEARETQVIFPVDVAKSPEKRTSPKRAQLVVIVGLLAFFLMLVWIFIKRAIHHVKSVPTSSNKWASMKRSWRLRS